MTYADDALLFTGTGLFELHKRVDVKCCFKTRKTTRLTVLLKFVDSCWFSGAGLSDRKICCFHVKKFVLGISFFLNFHFKKHIYFCYGHKVKQFEAESGSAASFLCLEASVNLNDLWVHEQNRPEPPADGSRLF